MRLRCNAWVLAQLDAYTTRNIQVFRFVISEQDRSALSILVQVGESEGGGGPFLHAFPV